MTDSEKLDKILQLCTDTANKVLELDQSLVIVREQLVVDDEPEHIGLRVKRIEQALSGVSEQVKSIYDHTIGESAGRKSVHELQREEERRARGGD